MANEEPKKAADWASQTKWIVLGVVALVALVLFKTEISGVIRNAGEVEITTSGLKIKTVQTVLGQAEVSNVKIKARQADGIQGNTFSSRQQGFQISWAEGGGWEASETLGPALINRTGMPPTVSMPLVLVRSQAVGNFRPSVNVVVEKIGAMSARAYFDASVHAMRQQGWQILTQDFDDSTQGGFISYFNSSMGPKLYQFARLAVANGNGYVITASQLPPDNILSDQLRAGLLQILNSFRTLEGK